MQKLLKAGVVAVLLTLFGSANVYATEKGPTVSDAHELLGDYIEHGSVTNGPDTWANYSGNGCVSSLKWVDSEYVIKIDWSGITSVVRESDNQTGVGVWGVIVVSGADGKKITTPKSANFLVPDAVSAKRIEKAMTILMNSCASKLRTKFD